MPSAGMGRSLNVRYRFRTVLAPSPIMSAIQVSKKMKTHVHLYSKESSIFLRNSVTLFIRYLVAIGKSAVIAAKEEFSINIFTCLVHKFIRALAM